MARDIPAVRVGQLTTLRASRKQGRPMAGSTAVPSIHSLKVVISCSGSRKATMFWTLANQLAVLRPRRGVEDRHNQKPGLMLKEWPG